MSAGGAGSAPARLLWDQGGLWSLMCWEACRQAGLEIVPITAAEVAAGRLAGAGLVLVPGGWPSLKLRALGRAGGRAIRRFVERGGIYLGLCGGAGLALSVEGGLGLVELQRVASGRRLAGASGPVRVELTEPEHPLWQGLGPSPCFHVWWPAQLARPRKGVVRVLATYAAPAPGFCTSDLRADRVPPQRWPELEERYGINLDPARLCGWPAVVEARRGRGRLILSHLHFDTPGDAAGLRVLANAWRTYLGQEPGPRPEEAGEDPGPAGGPAARAAELWERGRELGLWEERSPVMPLWKRASRGLEFWSLWRLCRALEPGWDRLSPSRRHRLARVLEGVWRRGPLVLQGLAADLFGQAASPQAEQARRLWFGVPRRVEGELGRALELLEQALLEVIRFLA